MERLSNTQLLKKKKGAMFHHFSDTCQVRPSETFTFSKPFFALNSSTAAAASACLLQGLMLFAFVCQIQPTPARKTRSWGTKYITAAMVHCIISESKRVVKTFGMATSYEEKPLRGAIDTAGDARDAAANRLARRPNIMSEKKIDRRWSQQRKRFP